MRTFLFLCCILLPCIIVAQKTIRTATDEERGLSATTTEPQKIADDTIRFIGPDGITFINGTEVDEDVAKEYAINVGVYAAVPILFMIFTMFLCICCLYCRCLVLCCKCCGRCCGCCRKKEHHEYTRCERFWPMIVFILLILLSFSWASTGIAENSKFSDTLSGTNDDSLTVSVPKLIDDTQGKVNVLRSKVNKIEKLIDNTTIAAEQVINDTQKTWNDGTSKIKNNVNDRSTQLSNLIVIPSCTACLGATYESQFGKSVGSQLSSILNTLNTEVQKPIDEFNELLDNLKTQVVDKKADIKDKLQTSVNENLDKVDSNLADAKKNVDDVIDIINDYDAQRNAVMYALFSLVMVSAVLVGLGMLLKFSSCFKINMWFSMLMAFLMWPLVAFHAPLSIVLADGCLFGAKEELKELQKTNITANVGNACLTKASLLKAFDVESELNFTDVIDTSFIDTYDFNVLLNISELNDIKSAANFLTVAIDYNISTSTTVTGVDCVNTAMNDNGDSASCCYTYQNLSSLTFSSLTGPTQNAINTGCCTAATNCYAEVLGRAEDYKFLENVITEVQANVTDLTNINDQVKATLVQQKEIVKNSTKLIDPFLDVGDELKAEATCGFLGDGYKSFKSFMCSKLVKHLYILGLSLGICAGCAWLSICCSMCNHSRWAWQKTDKKDENEVEDEFEDEEYLAVDAAKQNSSRSNSRRSSRSQGRQSVELTANTSNKPPTYSQAKIAPEGASEEGQSTGRNSYRGKTSIKFTKK